MTDKISGVYGPSAMDKVGAKKGYSSPKEGAKGDGVEFSSFAVELGKVSGELKKIPEIREEVVEDFKKQIAEGTYNPDMNKVARSLVSAGLMDREA